MGNFKFVWLSKRTVDMVLSLVAIMPVATIVGLTAIVSYAHDGRNPFYTQDRVGKDGRVFRLIKLRSMIDMDFEGWLESHPEKKTEYELYRKLKDDPRITPVGKIIRRLSIDELPQFFNVFKGDMSVVGPRPLMLEELEEYSGRHYGRMRPGVTGLWQTTNKGGTMDRRAFYDDFYIENVSASLDLNILLKTPRAMIDNG